MTHTPGPWHAEGVGVSQMTGVATAYTIRSESGLLGTVFGSAVNDSEQRANAHLIAAAPDLLALLVRIRDEEEEINFGTLGEIQRAITNARGES